MPLKLTICMDLLVRLQGDKKLDKTGRLAKSTIENVSNKHSLGISNLEDLYETMKSFDLITSISNSYIQFSQSITKINEITDFVEKCENKFRKKKEDVFSYADH